MYLFLIVVIFFNHPKYIYNYMSLRLIKYLHNVVLMLSQAAFD